MRDLRVQVQFSLIFVYYHEKKIEKNDVILRKLMVENIITILLYVSIFYAEQLIQYS